MEDIVTKKTRKNYLIKLIVVSVVVFFVVFGSLRIYRIFKAEGSTYIYNGATGQFSFDIVENNGLKQHVVRVYVFEDDGKEHEKVIPLRYGPKEMDDITVEKDIDNLVLLDLTKEDTLKNSIYITQDPKLVEESQRDSIVASLEIMKVVWDYSFGVYKIPMQMAYTSKGSTNLPIITCKDTESNKGVIFLKYGNGNRIYSEEGCVILEATTSEGLIKVADRLVLDLLGVF